MLYNHMRLKTWAANEKSSIEKGFTLIELSIVLVVIGLIVGGVLVAQDLIQASKIRATIADIEKFKTAATTFKLKYDGLPGDFDRSSRFFAGCGCDGNNNKLIGEDPASSGAISTYESIKFWHVLSLARLVDGNYKGTTEGGASSQPIQHLRNPVPPISQNGYYTMASHLHNGPTGWVNTFSFFTIAQGSYSYAGAVQPADAHAIDNKTDDGIANSGHIRATSSSSGNSSDRNCGPNPHVFSQALYKTEYKEKLHGCRLHFMGV